MLLLPTAEGVLAASTLLRGRVVRTPLLECRLFNDLYLGGDGRRLLLKAECHQITGSFKYRGALHRLLRLVEQQQRQYHDDEAENPSSSAAVSSMAGGVGIDKDKSTEWRWRRRRKCRGGVVAFSSGNFGQALAAASFELGIRCVVVSPHDAPKIKLDRIRSYGAEVRLSTARPGENREVAASDMARRISEGEEEGPMTLLHPFEDAHVVHGQGTVGVEILEQVKDMLRTSSLLGDTVVPSAIVVPCGGGGLTAGINLAVEAAAGIERSSVRVVSVEPAGYDDHARSFLSPGKERLSLADIYPPPAAPTTGSAVTAVNAAAAATHFSTTRSVACDALMAGAPGKITWAVNGPRLYDALASPGDESAARAMRVAFEHFRVVLEPSGALALAAVLDGAVPVDPGCAVCVVGSGGNVDMETFATLLGCRGQRR